MVTRARRRQIHHPRVADRVADRLRDRILGRDLDDGDVLPKQEDLIEEFGVSAQSLREALRILETEGLVRTIRGNVGGAEVQTPTPDTVAYMIAMVLQKGGVNIDDVADSLGGLEALCAAHAAQLPDRSALVARLRARNEESRALVAHDEFVRVARQFHEDLVAGCGNATLSVVLGAVETLWAAHVEALTNRSGAVEVFADPAFRARTLRSHVAIANAIERGDASAARRLVEEHMHDPVQHAFMGAGVVVHSAMVRHLSDERAGRPVP
jgi:GntR family transcriptional repressor for pyruvate dehydrogenase complex